MIEERKTRFAGVRRHTLGIVLALSVPVACLGAASPALAKEPTGDFAVFSQCPRFTAGVEDCFYAQVTGGEFTLGKLTVPITSTITQQGGTYLTPTEEKFVDPLNGETVSGTPQSVPGGLSSLIDCDELAGNDRWARARRRACRMVFERSRFMPVSETTELVGEVLTNSNNDVSRRGIALTLPVRIHLESPLLGRECYIGSPSEPIVQDLTSGTTSPPAPNMPISGKVGNVEFKDTFDFISLTEHTLVDNAFSVPGATGCGGPFSSIVDALIDGHVGLPSPAGHNTAILTGSADVGTVLATVASEQESKPSEEEGSQPGERWHEKHRGHRPGPSPWQH
jgi:hypothetical protein